MSCCVGADPTEQDSLQQAHVPVETALWVCHLRGQSGGILLWPMPASRCVGSGAPWRGFPCRPSLAAACDHRGHMVGATEWSVGGWSLPMLDMEASGRSHAAFRGQRPPVPGLSQLSKKPKAPLVLRLPAGCPKGSAAERAFGWYLSWVCGD